MMTPNTLPPSTFESAGRTDARLRKVARRPGGLVCHRAPMGGPPTQVSSDLLVLNAYATYVSPYRYLLITWGEQALRIQPIIRLTALEADTTVIKPCRP